MSVLIYKSIICFIIGLFWSVAYNSYLETNGSKGARAFLVLYSIICALLVTICIFGIGG